MSMLFSEPLRAEPQEILIVSADAEAMLVQHLRLELESLGFEVKVEPRAPNPRPFVDFTEVAEQTGATAVVRVFDDRSTVEIWTMNPETREGTKRDVRFDIQNPAYPSQAAVEIAELIRASRLDAEALEPTEDDNSEMAEDSPSPFETAIPEIKEASHDKPEPAPPPSPQKADDRFRLHLDAGAGIAAGTFEQPPAAQIELGAHWRFVDPAGVELIGRIPLASTRVEKSAGAADLTPWLVGLGVRLTFSNLLKRLHPAVGAGIGINILEIEGEAEPGFRPKSRTTATALLYLRIQGAIVLTKRLALVVGGTLGRSLPGIAVMIDDAPAVEWGHAVVHGYLGLEVGVI